MYSEAKNTVSFLSAIIALIMATVYCVLRLGFDNSGDTSLLSVFNILALGWFVLLLPANLRRARSVLKIKEIGGWAGNDAFVLLVGLFIVAVAGLWVSFGGLSLAPIFVPAGIIFFIFSFFDFLKQARLFYLVITTLFAVFYALWIAGLIWGSGVFDPLFLERIFTGVGYVDVLFHASIVGMIKTYGLVSTGLDGLPFVGFHFGSHWLYAQFAGLLRMRAITFYQLGFPVIFLPLMTNVFMLTALYFRNIVSPKNVFEIAKDYWFWIFFIALQIGIFPMRLYSEMSAIVWYRRYGSDSYSLSLTLFLLLFMLCGHFWQEREKNKFSEVLFLIVVVPLFLGLIAITKLFTGFLVTALGLYLFIRLGLYKKALYNASCCLGLLATYLAYNISSGMHTGMVSAGRAIALKPFYSIYSMPLVLLPFYPVFFYLFPLILIIFRLHQMKIGTLGQFFCAVKAKQMIDIEIVLALSVIGFIPAAMFYIPDGSGLYLTDLQGLMAALFLLAYLPRLFGGAIGEGVGRKFSLPDVKLIYILGAVIALPFFISLCFNYAATVRSALEININNRLAIVGNNNLTFSGIARQSINNRSPRKLFALLYPLYSKDSIAAGFKKNKYYTLKVSLYELCGLPLNEKKKSLVFVPSVDKLFWGILKKKESVPFIVPALTEMAMLDGLPPFVKENRVPYDNYSYIYYTQRHSQQTEAERWQAVLCLKAKRLGFSRLIILDSEKGGIKKIDCDKSIGAPVKI
ncbi:hypothetical protein HZC34_07770 [Candidatus Saganbacteria bacterium]|nr:hypothetical protein [Candidatus Saganbacteria bacterium]